MTVQTEPASSLPELTSLVASDLAVIERGGVLYKVNLANCGFGIPGEYKEFALTSPPSGWLECDGAAISRTTYANLFSAVGTTYGVGDGSTTFNVPDFREKHSEGASATNAVGDDLTQSIQSHFHGAGSLSAASAGAHFHSTATTPVASGSGGNGLQSGSGAAITGTAGAHTHTIAGTTSSAGGTKTRPDSIAVLKCIKF